MILTYREEFFHGKYGSNLPDFERKKIIPNHQILMIKFQ
jgi:hypothetical protein